MEGHLVHYKSDYTSVTEAVASKDPHGLTVLGVVFKVRCLLNRCERFDLY